MIEHPEIGGYFSLELGYFNNCPNFDGVLLNSGRNSLEYILKSLPSITRLWIPYFTCDTVLEPLGKLGIPYSFYNLNESLELSVPFVLGKNEYLLYTNYFGIKDGYTNALIKEYGDCLIVDNSQALYFSHSRYSFYSPRKFVGIPDGGVAYTPYYYDVNGNLDKDSSFERCAHLLKRHDHGAFAGYNDFRENSMAMRNQPIKRMSFLTQSLIKSIDFERIRIRRLANFYFLHSYLKNSNRLKIEDNFCCPLVYPYYTDNISLRGNLIKNEIYIATYWPNVLEWCKKGTLEYLLAKNILPLPIDQRYNNKDMKYILNFILNER